MPDGTDLLEVIRRIHTDRHDPEAVAAHCRQALPELADPAPMFPECPGCGVGVGHRHWDNCRMTEPFSQPVFTGRI